MTQRERILAMLKMGPCCGTQFLNARMPRYAARIYELRRDGHQIESRPCRLHDHESLQTVYQIAEEDQMRLAI